MQLMKLMLYSLVRPKTYNFLWGLLCCISGIQAQTELAKLEYTYLPQQQSENRYSRIKAEVTIPITLPKKGHYLLPKAQYRLHQLTIDDEVPFSEKQEIGDFHTFGVALGYTFPFGKDWRVVGDVGLRISSNLESSRITSKDYQYTGSLLFIRKRKGETVQKPSTLVLGFRYLTPGVVSYPLPILNYYQRFHPQWSFAVGTPITHLKYYSKNEKHTLQVFAGVERFYGTIQNPRTFALQNNEIVTGSNASMFSVFGALGYEYYLTKHFVLYGYAGHTIANEIRLRNEDREDVFVINNKNTLYLRSGIKFKL